MSVWKLIVEDYGKIKSAEIDLAVENKKHKVSLAEVSDLLDEVLNAGLKKNKGSLVKKIFNNKSVDIGRMEIKLGELQDTSLHFVMNEKEENFEIFLPNRRKIELAFSIVQERMYRKIKNLQWSLIKVIYSSLLDIKSDEDEENESIYLPAARTGFMLTKDIINKVGRKNTFNLNYSR